MTTEQTIRVLVEDDGISEEEARLRRLDGDLCLLRPSARFDEDLQGEEGVRLWEEAAKVAQTVADAVNNGPGTIPASPAVTMLAWDAAARAEEALRRARERRGEARAEAGQLRNTVFGEVLSELLEARGLPVTPFKVGKLAEQAGMNGWKVINRMADVGAEDPGHLDGLAAALDLSIAEMVELSHAYSFERRA